MDVMGAADVGDASLGKTEKSYLALRDKITHRAGHFLDRHGPIDAVLIEQVDKVGAKPAQASLDRFVDMLGAAVRADDPVALNTRAKLSCDHDLGAPAFERPTEQLLVGKGTVVLRRVEEGASEIDGAMQRGDRLAFIRGTVRLTHAHASEADR